MFNTVHSKNFTWWHFSEFKENDFEVLEKEFKFHPLDFDDIREDIELTKVDSYKHYIFGVLNVPSFNADKKYLTRQNLYIFFGKDYVVTITRQPIEALDRFFSRAQRSSGLRKKVTSKTTGYFLYRLIDFLYRDTQVILREIVRETDVVESEVYDKHTKVATTRLGLLRRNVLFFRHTIQPHVIFLEHLRNLKRVYLPQTLHIYFDDLQDTLNSLTLMIENVLSVVDGLFDVNEAFLQHRTNEIIRLLTIISVVLMPPTLITGYYGMNIDRLPFAHSIEIVSGIIIASLVIFTVWVLFIDKKK